VATTRSGGSGGPQNQAMAAAGFYVHPPGYFDHVPALAKERSTVGSASATGSIGGRTTWASGSDIFDPDRISEDHDDGVSSNGGFSEEGNASLVGFGEGASSTISGPISTSGARIPTSARQSSMAGGNTSPSASRPGGPAPSAFTQHTTSSPMGGGTVPPSSPSPASSTTTEPRNSDENDARMVDGMTFDSDVIDTAARPPRPVG
jgi:hypothetical protein